MRDPGCEEMCALTYDQLKRSRAILKYVEQIPAGTVTEMLERVLDYSGDSQQRKVGHFDVLRLIQGPFVPDPFYSASHL
jgi:hypothetical protein